ncbi:acetyl/propionyl/methylcrotonyl-CoA carboxylase subunit alpha [Pandoraea terrigena]|uniref:3-methylcrotonyl-CoA carboxylase n=1 Tax=Pandoraea terrigena TaxID=2508292 RepID=A0A5E4UBY1_9BURK|nr:acetyl-CoA carboxylase biotin carboxylase subunit [Pandoraea terrigena]VVD97535.1 3-methylcrotonyl-CoA carboxylase [Pandoraea terrigena]
MSSIKRLLIANRGEIAARVIRSAHAMGIETVAVYSDTDADAPHVRMATRAVCIGAPSAAASYLNIEAIVQAAHVAGADAIHPGYGFLSENAGFAQACADAGLTFVGPSAHAIRVMGDKAEAKVFMRNAGLPCIPGYDGEEQDAGMLAEAAARIGYPVIVKATAGGGGRGMRVVEDASAFQRALESARSEALAAFGSERMIVERVVREPRHIEIQVLVDRYGNGVHFGERDCSVQRRHQKLIEEAPAPGLSVETREQMGRAAVAAAITLGYEGVGTFEFLLDASGEFYFMEMNTRLQVEHPVTECIAGIDLVEWQLRVAMGEALDFSQQDVRLAGHAIEVRLCAEDERNAFLPQSGSIELWAAPDGIRVEHAVRSGFVVSPYYDSMFAKLIGSGKTREDARRSLVKALRDTVVLGIRTNRQALIRCLEHAAFVAGGVNTGFLVEHKDDVLVPQDESPWLALAVVGAVLSPGTRASGWRGSAIHLADDTGVVYRLDVAPCGQRGLRIESDAHSITFDVCEIERPRVRFSFGGVDREAFWVLCADQVHVQIDGHAWSFVDRTYVGATASDGERDGRLRAPSNGRVVALYASSGQRVAEGDALLTIEAMKMEHTVIAPAAAIVRSVLIEVGQSVTTGKVLLEFEPAA